MEYQANNGHGRSNVAVYGMLLSICLVMGYLENLIPIAVPVPGSYVMIEDRGEAVKYAIEHGEKGDIIVLAGKGHEDYQEIKGVRYHQTDKELVQKAMEDLAR